MSIFDAIGGSPAVHAAVEDFYQRLQADPRLAGYFVDVDMARLKAHQRAFLAAAIGGSEIYRGRDMAAAHRHLAISDVEFDAVVEHLVGVLTGLGVDGDTIATIGVALTPLRADIVTVRSEAIGA